MSFRKVALVVSSLALTVQLSLASAFAAEPKGPSRYLQCDGQPNNTTAGETAARLIGALTLLSLFAPAPEAPDASARKFGQDGVDICNSLLEGEKDVESNPVRRLELILARALHKIEAKNYQEAITDVQLARSEATKQGFMADPYFSRSFARSFPRIEAEALVRMGKYREAQDLLLTEGQHSQFAFYPVLTTATYSGFLRDKTSGEDALLDAQARLWPSLLAVKASRFEMSGRFAEAAKARDSRLVFLELFNNPKRDSLGIASTALSHALAGNWERAEILAEDAKSNLEKRVAQGEPETNRSESVEILDLVGVLRLAKDGNLQQARRNFSARSQWIAASFGAVLAVNDQLRKDAPVDELVGGLAKSSDQLWQEKVDANLAEKLAKDADNKSLFQNIYSMDRASDYERLSKRVWATDKSKILSKEKANAKEKDRFDGYLATYFDYQTGFAEKFDAFLLHSALVAQKRGYKKFVFHPILESGGAALVHFVEPENEEKFADFTLDAGTVAAELTPAIPDPLTIKQNKAARTKKKAE
jgi:hypothetical protein